MSAEQSDESFWEEHKVMLSMTVGGVFAAAGALAMHRLNRQHADLDPTEVIGEIEISDQTLQAE